ncbi:hypothetical protein RKE30_10840 [Streptomyces sp. Li-HN-5-11]|uniref:hypothetical protein n=1 Tax=Streptomyces sp. Li-HN-5-11 TaxID=3075432 RepID=UPI0028B0D039|nr:hypothetical protein [Streptomyces sp. Li-HN-5-11]WNM30868.1 hypothetical protein RKE30_10840 [Streptomyces sp. Li-HN-5-11]
MITISRTALPELALTLRRNGHTVRHQGSGSGFAAGVSAAAQRRQNRRSGGLGVPQEGQGAPVTSSGTSTGRTTGRGATGFAGRTGWMGAEAGGPGVGAAGGRGPGVFRVAGAGEVARAGGVEA